MTDVDAFLEHFGVKGMRWGVKGAAIRAVSAREKADRAEASYLAKVEKAERNKTRNKVLKVAAGATVIAGGVFAAKMLSNKGNKTIRSLPKPPEFPFSATGKNFKIQAQDGRTFDLLVKAYTEQQKNK